MAKAPVFRTPAKILNHPECSVCRYMNRHPEFRQQIEASSYFVPGAPESLMGVVKRWDDPFIPVTMYYHMKKHMVANEIKGLRQTEEQMKQAAVPLDVIEGEVKSDTYHERGLDEFIMKGRELVARGELKINSATYLKAIQLKLDAEKSTKDRRLDAFKMMSGAFKQKETNTNGQTDAGTATGA